MHGAHALHRRACIDRRACKLGSDAGGRLARFHPELSMWRALVSPSSHTTQANQWHTGLHPAYNSQVERVVVVPPGALLLLLGHRQGAAGGLRARLSLEGLEQLARAVDLLKRGAVVAATILIENGKET